MIPVEEALDFISASVGPLAAERVPISCARDRVLSAPARSRVDLPPFAQSAVDGYALRSQDVASASASAPVRLRLSGTIAAGPQDEVRPLASGTAVRILTGGHVPPGSDAIARQEIVQVVGEGVFLDRPVPAGTDLRDRGEELATGDVLAREGQRITPGLLAALSMAGLAAVVVHRQPRITVLVTGDEITAPGATLRTGEVYDANGPLAESVLFSWGYGDVTVAYVPDDEGALEERLAAAFGESDLVVTTGGVSVGDRDHVPDAARRLGAREVFWKVAQKPGKPLFFAVRGTTALLGLPGNPAAVLVNLCVHVRRALDRLEGVATPGPVLHAGRLAAPFRPDGRRLSWLRVRVATDAEGTVTLTPLGRQASHMLSNLGEANGLACVPAGEAELPAGTVVRWLPLPGPGAGAPA